MAITTTSDLRKSGFSPREILRRCLPSGPWQLLLPGVVLQKPSPPSRLDKLHAAQTYAGPNAVITGADALARQGAVLTLPRHIHVLYGKNNRRTHPGILFERTIRPPDVVEHGELRLACPARAALDMARRETDPRSVVAVLDAVLRSGLCTLADLEEELRRSHQRGTALVRQALRLMSAASDPPSEDASVSSSQPSLRPRAKSRAKSPVTSRGCVFEHT